MAINSLAGLATALRTKQLYMRSSGGNSWQVAMYSSWAYGTLPPAGAGGPSNTANGIVPTSSTTGAMALPLTPDKLYIVGSEISQLATNVGTAQAQLHDVLFMCGSYNSVATTGLSSQPSFSSRLQNGSYAGLQLWMETNGSVQGAGYAATITYTNESGATGHTTSVTSATSPNTWPGQLTPVPLASGDCGLQTIEQVQITATAVTPGNGVNFLITRPIRHFRMPIAGKSYVYPMDMAGLREVHPSSCLVVFARTTTSNTNVRIPLELDLASG